MSARNPATAEAGEPAASLRQQKGDIVTNKDQIMGKWHEIKGKVKEKWGDLTDDEVTEAEGTLEGLAGKLQQKYGGAKQEILSQLQKL